MRNSSYFRFDDGNEINSEGAHFPFEDSLSICLESIQNADILTIEFVEFVMQSQRSSLHNWMTQWSKMDTSCGIKGIRFQNTQLWCHSQTGSDPESLPVVTTLVTVNAVSITSPICDIHLWPGCWEYRPNRQSRKSDGGIGMVDGWRGVSGIVSGNGVSSGSLLTRYRDTSLIASLMIGIQRLR